MPSRWQFVTISVNLLTRRSSLRAQLPTEPDLARSLGVSRVTLRQALHMLQDEGVLLRRSGLGTFVAERLGFRPVWMSTTA